MGLLGAHVSTAGGTARAFGRGADIGCESLQIFVKSPNQWRARPLDEKDVAAFHSSRAAAPQPVVAHAAYLINLASPKEDVQEKSMAALLLELQRCTALGVDGLVLHPGAHLGNGLAEGIAQIARSLDAILATDPDITTKVLLENTAGQGSTIGATFSELSSIIELCDHQEKLGICFDTCHAFSAGYELRTAEGYDAVFTEISELIGFERLNCVHINDSQHPLGSRKDRHENIGAGEIGLEFFAKLVNDPALAGLPLILETPLGDDEDGHRVDLQTLRAQRNAQ